MSSDAKSSLEGHSPKVYVHPEFQKVINFRRAAAQNPDAPEIKSALQRRELVEPMLASALRSLPFPADDVVGESKHQVTSADGATISVSRFATPHQHAGQRILAPAILYAHGGGMISGSVEIWRPAYLRYVEALGIQIFAVDYRLAPESPAPGPVEDFYAALKWLSANAESFHVDPARLILWGDSAGGGIVAGTAIIARDRKLSPPVAKQILIYPMLDDRTEFPEDWPLRDFVMWSESDNALGWTSLLGESAGKEDSNVNIYDAPGRATVSDLVELPSTFIDVGGLDLFYRESLIYATRLLGAYVDVEFHSYPGVPHAFEILGPTTIASKAFEHRKRAVENV